MLKCFEGENTNMCEAIRQMVDEGIMLGEKQRALDIARRIEPIYMFPNSGAIFSPNCPI